MLTSDGRRHRADVLDRLSARSPLASLSAAQQDSLRDLLRAVVAQG